MSAHGFAAGWARWVGRPPPSSQQLLKAATDNDPLFLPRVEIGWVGSAVALTGLVLGVLWARGHQGGPGDAVGWLALFLVLAGMVIQMTWRHIDNGWLVDFTRRGVQPVGTTGPGVQAHELMGSDYCVMLSPGDKWRSLVIDLRHNDTGRVARLFQTPGPARMTDHRALSALADVLARRLHVRRDGMTF